MRLGTLGCTMAVGFAAFPVLCPQRSLAQVADTGKFSPQPVALFDESVVIPCRHLRLYLFPENGNRYRNENTVSLNASQS